MALVYNVLPKQFGRLSSRTSCLRIGLFVCAVGALADNCSGGTQCAPGTLTAARAPAHWTRRIQVECLRTLSLVQENDNEQII